MSIIKNANEGIFGNQDLDTDVESAEPIMGQSENTEVTITETDTIDLTAEELINMDHNNPPEALIKALASQAEQYRKEIAAKNKETDFTSDIHTRGLFQPAKHIFIGTGSPAKKYEAELEKFLQGCIDTPPLAPRGAALSDVDQKRNKLLRVMINCAMNHKRFKSVKYRDVGPKLPRDLNLAKVIEPFILKHSEYLVGAAPYYGISL